MTISGISRTSTIEEVAAIVSQALEAAGIIAPLSGGAAVSVYSVNEYESVDLDFITSERNRVIADALAPTGFRHRPGRKDFVHPQSELTVEFPPGPLAFGETVVAADQTGVIGTRYGPLRIITPTQSVMDRLANYLHFHDNQAFDQAVMVARRQTVDWEMLRDWARREGLDSVELERFTTAVSRD